MKPSEIAKLLNVDVNTPESELVTLLQQKIAAADRPKRGRKARLGLISIDSCGRICVGGMFRTTIDRLPAFVEKFAEVDAYAREHASECKTHAEAIALAKENRKVRGPRKPKNDAVATATTPPTKGKPVKGK